MTNSGVPNSSAMLGDRHAGDRHHAVGRRESALRGQTFGASASISAGSAAAVGAPRVVDLLGVPGPGGMRDHMRSGALTPRMPRPLAMTWRVACAQREPRRVQLARRLVALRQHPARVVEPVVVAGEIFQVAATPGAVHAGTAAVFSTRGNSPRLRISVPSLSWVSRSRCAVSGVRPSSAALRASAESRACAYCT